MTDSATLTSADEIDFSSFDRIDAVRSILQVLVRSTGLRTALVARVTSESWTLCAIEDGAGFALQPGDQLELQTTFWNIVRGTVVPLIIHKASEDPRYKDHPAPRIYGVESYIAVPLHRRDGSYFGVLCALDIVHQEFSDDVVTILNLFSDLIAFELEADERQNRQTDALRQIEEFIAVARHDLRQVLTLLYGWAQLLDNRIKRGADLSELEEMSATLLNSSREAILLSESLLDTAMVETGSFELDMSRMNLSDVVDAIVQDIRASARDHTVEVSSPNEVWIRGDRHRIGQVIRNLLDNAVKYVAPSRGSIKLDIHLSESDPKFVVITVQDAGNGVSDDELPRLFDQHFRATSAKSGSARGSGLGLYVVRQIVEAHGGSIHAGHSPLGGLAMRLTLPTG